MKTRIALCVCICALSLAFGSGHQAKIAQGSSGEFKGLNALFNLASGVVRDTNGDGLPDIIAARIIVPDRPTSEDIQAAANVAGRFGFETVAATLPIVMRESGVRQPAAIALPVLIGRQNALVQKLAERGVIDIKSLKPGQGLVAMISSPLGGPDGVVIVGGDDEGTLNAANVLASRLPRLWGMSGITLPAIEEQALRHLQASGVAALGTAVDAIIVDSDRRGIAAVNVRAQIQAGDAARAMKAFEEVDLAHRRGQEIRTLNFANAALTSIELYAKAERIGRVMVNRSGLNSRALTPPIDPDELAPDSPGERGRPGEATPTSAQAPLPPGKTFDLSNTFSIDGWFGDGYVDLIPDRTETSLVISHAADSFGAAHIAARLGLETTGVTLPITKMDDKVRDATREPSPILVGRTNELTQKLIKIGKTRLDDLQPGEGAVQIIPKAFGNATATVVAGADDAGTEAAALYLARRAPYLWDIERGAPSFEDVTTQTARFLQARSGAGQASQALSELDEVMNTLKGKTIESFEAKLFLEAANPALDGFITERVKEVAKPGTVKVTSQGRNEPVPVFEDKLDIPWEVDEFWAKLRADVLPQVKSGSSVEIETRLSEPPEVRRDLVEKVRAELVKAGASNPRVRVLSAYKQGFLWLTEEVIPQLKGKPVKSVRIKVAKYEPDFSKKYKFYTVPTRWIHELYPVDEIFKRDLGVAFDAFQMELVDKPKDIYSLEAFDAAGKLVYQATFSPKLVEREYLDKFPGWSRVQVTTGWLAATVDGKTVSDARIATDPERFWDHYQSSFSRAFTITS